MAVYSDYLYQKASRNRIPLNGCFELSPICNFHCRMCYVRKTHEQIRKEGKRIREWKEWIDLAKQCKEEGMLYLLLTGGEPFLYPHFRELYEELHHMGFIISINSNGTMIDEKTVEWLKTMAPGRINITLYGASADTYERICGNADGYYRDKSNSAVERGGYTCCNQRKYDSGK
ncbi:MAG: radical SAM protein [Lachnoclostridium sp.]